MPTAKADTEKLRRGGEVIRLVLGKLEPLLEAGRELERAGGLAQTIGESEQRLASLQTEERAARDAIDEATRKASDIVEIAKREAETIVRAANDTAREASKQEADTRQRLADITAELRDAERRLTTTRTEIEALKQRAAAV